MRVPYTILHTPQGYQLDVDTRTAVVDAINISVDAPSKAEAIMLLTEEMLVALKRMPASKWPESEDWIPGDDELDITP